MNQIGSGTKWLCVFLNTVSAHAWKKWGKPRHKITVRPEFFYHNTTTLAPEGYMYSELLTICSDHIPLPKVFLSTQERALGKDSLGSSKSTFRNYAAVKGRGNFPMSVSANYNPRCTWRAQGTYKHCEKRKQIAYGKKNADITHTHKYAQSTHT